MLRMRESVLEAFEAGDFDHLPALGYAQGMVSSYARYLGLDSREISELYEREHAEYVAGVTGRAPSGLASLSDEPSYKGAASATNIIKPVSMTPPSLSSGQDDSAGVPISLSGLFNALPNAFGAVVLISKEIQASPVGSVTIPSSSS